MSTSSNYNWALDQLRRSDVRLTPVRKELLRLLATKEVPLTLQQINGRAGLDQRFDDTTVYRTLILLTELEVVQQLGLRGRSTCFMLNVPGGCFSFLVCSCCGKVKPLPQAAELRALERQIASAHQYANLYHELVLYGICPDCRDHPQTCVKPSKLIPGKRFAKGFAD